MQVLGREWLQIAGLAGVVLLGAAFPLFAEEPSETANEKNWIEGTLDRFFGQTHFDGEVIDGEGLELVSPYVKHANKTIEVVIIRQVKSFETGWDDNQMGVEQMLNSFTQTFQDYTQKSIIREYLLFKAGDKVEPFDLADSERMLRDLPYITDIRIHVVPLDGEDDKVGIVVETNDRWPLGMTATIVNANSWRARLFSSNVGGIGLAISNEVIRNKNEERDWGYHGSLLKRNLGGTFWDAIMDYESSYRKDKIEMALDRTLIHPLINILGGFRWKDLNDYEFEDKPRGYIEIDTWAGWAHRLYDHRVKTSGARTMLVPAVRIQQRDFYNRPSVSADSSRGSHNYFRYLASLALQRTKSYKTSYLFGEGEVEDLATGTSLKLSGGFEDGEFENRPGVFFDSAALSMRKLGDVAFGEISLGGYLDDGKIEDGILEVGSGYISPLLGKGRFRHRLFGTVNLTWGIGRHSTDKIALGDKSGIFEMANGKVYGTNRLVIKGLYRVFTHWNLLGFRMSFLTFTDLGVIGGANDALLKEKFYLSSGLGVRLRNPSLVLPTVQLRISMVSNVGDSGFSLGIKVGNATVPNIKYPGIKPGALGYE
ncbi:MAG: hypothetical protein GY780_17130 [bacterium]|nr:hypothetical protein [bacterium]